MNGAQPADASMKPNAGREIFPESDSRVIAEREDRQRAPMGEGVVTRVLEVRQHPRRAGAGVDADRHIELGRLLVYRMKIGMIDGLVALDAAKEDAHCAEFLGPLHFFERFRDRAQRQHRDEFQPAVGFCRKPSPSQEL